MEHTDTIDLTIKSLFTSASEGIFYHEEEIDFFILRSRTKKIIIPIAMKTLSIGEMNDKRME